MPRPELPVWRPSQTSKVGFTGVASENVKSAVVREHGADEGLRRRQVIGPCRGQPEGGEEE